MKHPIVVTLLLYAAIAHAAVEPGFVDLLGKDHVSFWMQCGPGKMIISNGETLNSSNGEVGVAWYSKVQYSDFTLKVEFKGVGREFNSGVRLRLPRLENDPSMATELGYEVGIHQSIKPYKWTTGSIHRHQTPMIDALNPQGWNEFEITVIGQSYSVMLNGKW